MTTTGATLPAVSADALRRLLDATSAGAPTVVARDGGDRATEVDDGGARWRLRYGTGGDPAAVTGPDGAETRYEYDGDRRLVLVRRPDGRCTRYSYDDRDRMVEVNDRGGSRRIVHDSNGLVRQVVHGQERVSCYDYDAAGRLVEARAGGVATSFHLDASGRPRRIAQTVDGVMLEAGLDYDADGRLACLRLPGGRHVAYTWDGAGRPADVRLDGRLLARFGYDDEARAVQVRLANGFVDLTRADPVDGRTLTRELRDGDRVLLRRDYGYDEASRVVADGVRRYEYADRGQLTAAEDGETGERWSFGYDARGSLAASEHGHGDDWSRTRFDHDGDRLTAVEQDGRTGAVTCDDQERLTGWSAARAQWAWRHDAAGHLVQVRRDGDVVADLVNDHKGRPVVVRTAGGTERYLYGPDDELIAVTDLTGAPVRCVVRTPLGVLAEVDAGPEGGAVRFLHCDARGTCLAESDLAGRVLARHRYDPFGLPLDDPAEASPVFGGRAYLAAAGLYHLGARWYCPALRRFLTPDPWTCGPDDERIVHPVFPGSRQPLARAELLADWVQRPRLLNRYAFCGNDPVNRVDPNGHWSVGGVLLSLLGAVWTLPNTLIGVILELTCLVGEVLRWLAWAITLGRVSWQTPGVDVAASGRLNAFALVFSGGWLGSIPGLLGVTFGNVFFVNGRWRENPELGGPGDILPTAYAGRVRIPRTQSLYEHELRHTNQYGWFGPFFHAGLPLFGVYEWDVLLHGYRGAWTERDARAHGEGPAAADPAPQQPRVQVRVEPAGPPVRDDWVYWRAGGTTRVLRTDGAGRLHAAPVAGSPDPWDYTDEFRAPAGTAVEIAVSEGARPVPASLLATPGLFVTRTPAAGGGGDAVVAVPGRLIELGTPQELALWPLTREPATEAYSTAGLPQAAAAWTDPAGPGNLTVPEGGRAPDPGNARPRVRGLAVRGRIDARVTDVRVGLLDRTAAVVPLEGSGGTPVTDVAATLDPAQGQWRPFEAVLRPVTPAGAFGPVLVTVVGQGAPEPVVEAYLAHLCGLQAALVDDPAPASPGRVPTEADEVVVADFARSPQDSLVDLSSQTRLRRMVSYPIAGERRPLLPGGPPLMRPRMPLWMGEMQLVGVATADLQDLLRRRDHRRAAAGRSSAASGSGAGGGSTSLSFRWRLRLAWDGPDASSGALTGPVVRPGQRHAYEIVLPGTPVTVTAVLHYDAQGRLTGRSGAAGSDPTGAVTGAYQPPATPLPFPVAGRRTPAVRVSQNRRWGRDPAAAEQPSLVLEFQPAVADAAGAELVRGGDGELALDEVRLDGALVVTTLPVVTTPPGAPPAAGTPLLGLPAFRVVGTNPAAADVEEVVRALVRDHVTRHQADAHVRPLSTGCWEQTVLAILRHESGRRYRQFDDRGTARRPFSRQSTTWYFGHENQMPLFGPPHGYGIGQLDFFSTPPRGATDDEVWNWVENLRAAVLVVLDEKAAAAWALIGQHVPTPLDQRTRAVFQRELVRRYNGGTEFRWTGTAWAIQPPWRWRDDADHSAGPHPNLLYPNHVLGTSVVYYRGANGSPNTPDGAATQFEYPPPAAFDPAQFPPETAQP